MATVDGMPSGCLRLVMEMQREMRFGQGLLQSSDPRFFTSHHDLHDVPRRMIAPVFVDTVVAPQSKGVPWAGWASMRSLISDCSPRESKQLPPSI